MLFPQFLLCPDYAFSYVLIDLLQHWKTWKCGLWTLFWLIQSTHFRSYMNVVYLGYIMIGVNHSAPTQEVTIFYMQINFSLFSKKGLLYFPLYTLLILPCSIQGWTIFTSYKIINKCTLKCFCHFRDDYFLDHRCSLVPVIAEVDRILRPEGKLIVWDNIETISEIENMAKSLQWKTRLTYSKDSEGFLYIQKTLWRPK